MSNTNLWSGAVGAVDEPRGKVSLGPGSPEPQWKEQLRDGTSVLIRPIHGADAHIERSFIEGLSEKSRRFRFLGEVKTPSSALVEQLTHPERTGDVAYVALIADGGEKREIGVGRFSAREDGRTCECAVAVSDQWQQRGLATTLMRHLIATARQRGIECMYSVDREDNEAMRDLAAYMGFTRRADPDDPMQVIHTLDLLAPLRS